MACRHQYGEVFMRESPRTRRLRTDRQALIRLKLESTILDFEERGRTGEQYLVRYYGKGFWRPDGTNDVLMREWHEVRIELGAGYPRMMPELTWVSPIFHPNISASGVVCLGGYGTHWVPSLNLDELCTMLWDMIRYQNYDVESPYNRDAALWAKVQTAYNLPIDRRSIRDKVSGQAPTTAGRPPVTGAAVATAGGEDDGVFVIDEDGILEAEVVETESDDILFLD
jgi:ubiquitin-protein ligase